MIATAALMRSFLCAAPFFVRRDTFFAFLFLLTRHTQAIASIRGPRFRPFLPILAPCSLACSAHERLGRRIVWNLEKTCGRSFCVNLTTGSLIIAGIERGPVCGMCVPRCAFGGRPTRNSPRSCGTLLETFIFYRFGATITVTRGRSGPIARLVLLPTAAILVLGRGLLCIGFSLSFSSLVPFLTPGSIARFQTVDLSALKRAPVTFPACRRSLWGPNSSHFTFRCLAVAAPPRRPQRLLQLAGGVFGAQTIHFIILQLLKGGRAGPPTLIQHPHVASLCPAAPALALRRFSVRQLMASYLIKRRGRDPAAICRDSLL